MGLIQDLRDRYKQRPRSYPPEALLRRSINTASVLNIRDVEEDGRMIFRTGFAYIYNVPGIHVSSYSDHDRELVYHAYGQLLSGLSVPAKIISIVEHTDYSEQIDHVRSLIKRSTQPHPDGSDLSDQAKRNQLQILQRMLEEFRLFGQEDERKANYLIVYYQNEEEYTANQPSIRAMDTVNPIQQLDAEATIKTLSNIINSIDMEAT